MDETRLNIAKKILMKKMESGHRPYYNTLVKYNLQNEYEYREYKPAYVPREPETKSKQNKESYTRNRNEVLKKDTLRRQANGQKVKPSTLQKYGL